MWIKKKLADIGLGDKFSWFDRLERKDECMKVEVFLEPRGTTTNFVWIDSCPIVHGRCFIIHDMDRRVFIWKDIRVENLVPGTKFKITEDSPIFIRGELDIDLTYSIRCWNCAHNIYAMCGKKTEVWEIVE